MVEDVFNKVLPILAQEIEDRKKSYFSEEGKPEAGWAPLKNDTLRKKQKYAPPENVSKFNTFTGNLKNSLIVTAELQGNEIKLKVTAKHKNGDAAIDALINEYGRDFLNFDDTEMEWIINRLMELINESSR